MWIKITSRAYWRQLIAAALLILVQAPLLAAQQTRIPLAEPFVPGQALSGRVDFWRLIFTKYGEDQLVFHHRSHPEIIYSVLDFSDVARTRKGKDFDRFKERTIEEEIRRIQGTLTKLAEGKEPESPFERRIQHLFHEIIGTRRSAFRDAFAEDQIRSQTGIRERFREGIRRSGRYLHAIETVFNNAGLPPELARLPLVESSFDYKAYSSKGAAGIWQFTRSTGRLFMRTTASIDERRDPIVSSRAAAKYLAHSFQKVQSWPLTITSYNHGLSGVMRAVNQTGSRDLAVIIRKYDGDSFGFASSNFYTEFLAALDVERNWRLYFPDLDRDSPWSFDEVRLDKSVGYKTVLSRLGISDDEFYADNLALLAPVRSGRVSIPAGFLLKVRHGEGGKLASLLKQGAVQTIASGGDYYNDNIGKIRSENRTAATHEGYQVAKGDTIGSIADKFGVSERELMSANGISDPKKLRLGQRVTIPQKVSQAKRSKTRAVSPRVAAENKTVKKPGERPEKYEAPQGEKVHYVVKKGDKLVEIAKKNGITLSELQKLNPRLGRSIQPGQELVIK